MSRPEPILARDCPGKLSLAFPKHQLFFQMIHVEERRLLVFRQRGEMDGFLRVFFTRVFIVSNFRRDRRYRFLILGDPERRTFAIFAFEREFAT